MSLEIFSQLFQLWKEDKPNVEARGRWGVFSRDLGYAERQRNHKPTNQCSIDNRLAISPRFCRDTGYQRCGFTWLGGGVLCDRHRGMWCNIQE